MFLFGILSSPLPYLLMAAFYFLGFATGMFQKEKAGSDENLQVQVKNIHVEPQAINAENADEDYHFYQDHQQKKLVDAMVNRFELPPRYQKEKQIYIVHDIKIPSLSLSEFHFCRPPPCS